MKWKINQQVIFGVDVKIIFNNFRNMLCGTVSCKTIFIENPDTEAGFKLYKHMQTKQLNSAVSYMDKMKSDAVKNLNINQFKDLIITNKFTNEYVLFNAVITELNIDCNTLKKFILKCMTCYSTCNPLTKRCQNTVCSDFNNKTNTFYDFETTLSISDHTSTLKNVKIS
jgi:hypothetical protein